MTSAVSLYDPSPEALAPLMSTFWSPRGWRDPPSWPGPEVFEAAIDAGVMFRRPLHHDHDSWVRAARSAVGDLPAREVGDAFLASLSSRRLDLRSALGSYAVARHLPGHPITPNGSCRICGLYDDTSRDANELSFERFKWGGVARDSVEYAAFDLLQFARAPRLAPTSADIAIGQQMIDCLRELAPQTSAAQAAPKLTMIPGNKNERDVVVDILGVCGILQTAQYPGYSESFIPWDQRPSPAARHVFGHYPTWWWHAADGVNTAALQKFLPQLH